MSMKVSSPIGRATSIALPVLGLVLLLAACGPAEEAAPEPIRPVRVVTVETQAGGETVSLAGQIHAQDEVSLSFRTGGRMIARPVNVGDRVVAGQIIGRLDPETARNAMETARANLAAAMGLLTQTRNDYQRQQTLLERGFTTRVRYDQALQAMQSAQAQVDATEAQLSTAQEQLTYTELVADSGGIVTAVGAESGEVVPAGRMIVQLARENGRDAVFDVPARLIQASPPDPEVTVALTTDGSVRATGRVREVAPQADPVTRTFRVRVGLSEPPEAMRLGSTVNGSIRLGAPPGIAIPASALTSSDRRPAVWIVDPDTSTVSLQAIEVQRYDLAQVVVAQGLEPGDIVVTAGVQVLRPGQQIRLPGAAQ